MNVLELVVTIIGSSIVTTAMISFLAKTWFAERIKLAFQKEHTLFNTDLQWEVKVRERAERVAEYISLARSLREDSTEEEYRKANRLSWELAMWLPEEIYKLMIVAITKPDKNNNVLTVVIAVRKLLLKDAAGNLSEDNIGHHAPGIGKKQSS